MDFRGISKARTLTLNLNLALTPNAPKLTILYIFSNIYRPTMKIQILCNVIRCMQFATTRHAEDASQAPLTFIPGHPLHPTQLRWPSTNATKPVTFIIRT